ncbi:AfsA-related hotdog domain-containing protein [Streptomyces sp. 4N124]|uniref:AfsA-related hotdog domain-containing protein n=1 Tax=Streptomyces sp. 4N124 TaxID=3457420 RepID=UPI003FD335DD
MSTTPDEGERHIAPLDVDETHPFFDHPVDHVPAMLLLAGLLELTTPADRAPALTGRMRLRLHVPKMAELGRPVDLSALRPAGTERHWTLQAHQDDTTIIDGELELWADPPTTGSAPMLRTRPEGAHRNLVHRHRPENVMIGHAQVRGDRLTAPLRLPPPDHYLSLREPVTGSLEMLLEGGRQFGILYGHVVQRRAADAQMLLLGIAAELPVTLAPHTAVTLRARTGPTPGSRGSLTIEYLGGGAHGPKIGELSLDYQVVSAAAYRRMRGAKAAS